MRVLRKLLRVISIAALGLGALVLALAAGLVVFLHTDRFRELARDRLEGLLDDSLPADFSIARLEGSPFYELALEGVAARFDGAEVLYLRRLAVSYSVTPVLTGGPLTVRVTLPA